MRDHIYVRLNADERFPANHLEWLRVTKTQGDYWGTFLVGGGVEGCDVELAVGAQPGFIDRSDLRRGECEQ
jgi:hypothetical protein